MRTKIGLLLGAILGIILTSTLIYAEEEIINRGDIVYRTSCNGSFDVGRNPSKPGHVGIYIGKDENSVDLVIDAVYGVGVEVITLEQFKKGIHRMSNKPTDSNYNEFSEPISTAVYLGSMTTKVKPRPEQIEMIIRYCEDQVKDEKPYDTYHIQQKGPGRYDCVGLAEAAYEFAGLNIKP